MQKLTKMEAIQVSKEKVIGVRPSRECCSGGDQVASVAFLPATAFFYPPFTYPGSPRIF